MHLRTWVFRGWAWRWRGSTSSNVATWTDTCACRVQRTCGNVVSNSFSRRRSVRRQRCVSPRPLRIALPRTVRGRGGETQSPHNPGPLRPVPYAYVSRGAPHHPLAGGDLGGIRILELTCLGIRVCEGGSEGVRGDRRRWDPRRLGRTNRIAVRGEHNASQPVRCMVKDEGCGVGFYGQRRRRRGCGAEERCGAVGRSGIGYPDHQSCNVDPTGHIS